MNQLQRGEHVEEVLTFGTGQWAARITCAPCHHIDSVGGRFTLSLTADELAALALPHNEGVYFYQDELPLRYFVEKDYPCVHPRGGEAMEPITETFTAPEGFPARKSDAIC
jgi:hypothetical protein